MIPTSTTSTTRWQILETRDAARSECTRPESLQPQYQYVWSPRYIDAPVLRDENTDADGLCDDGRIYYLRDANFNVTALIDPPATPAGTLRLQPLGVLTIYDATWANIRSDSSYAAGIHTPVGGGIARRDCTTTGTAPITANLGGSPVGIPWGIERE